ncbi:MAG: BlaI/MecI/CopY family transcriptional regulator [Candidatus Dojkabacteria bacterium]
MNKKILSPKIDITKKGIGKFLGTLESEIMEVIWRTTSGTVQEIREDLNKDYSFNTIMTVLNRLVAKGLIRKYLNKKPFEYSAVMSKDDFLHKMSGDLLLSMSGEMRRYILSQFADTMDINAEDIKKLKKHLEDKRKS